MSLYKHKTPLFMARLSRDSGKPAVAEIVEVTYHAAKKKHGYHAVKIPRQRFPAEAHADDLHTTPAAAQERLIAKIQDAINEHAYQIDTLYSALLAYKDTALIDWSSIKSITPHTITIETKELILPPEFTIIDGPTNFENAILAAASRKSAQRRLVVDAQRAALDDAARLQQIAALKPRQPSPEFPAEIPMLIARPKKHVVLANALDETTPTETPHDGPITSAADEDPTRDTPRHRPKPHRLFKGTRDAE